MKKNKIGIILSIIGWGIVFIISTVSLIMLIFFPDDFGISIYDESWYNLLFVFFSPILCVYLIIVNYKKLKDKKPNYPKNMPFKCKIGFHTWHGCICTECGITRDEQHEWYGCKCQECGKIRIDHHDWSKDCEECSICGSTRWLEHDWLNNCEKCSKCNKTRQNAHDWSIDSEKCSKCSKIKHNAND